MDILADARPSAERRPIVHDDANAG
jgi:hypothetical protein